MYPAVPKYLTYVTIEGSDSVSEGAARPGFFRGVATVVTKLFNIVQPTNAYFGQKDGLQAIMVQQFVRDLNIPVHITVCPIVRAVAVSCLTVRFRKTVLLSPRAMRICLLRSVLPPPLCTSLFAPAERLLRTESATLRICARLPLFAFVAPFMNRRSLRKSLVSRSITSAWLMPLPPKNCRVA